MADRYSKLVLTVIAVTLVFLSGRLLLGPRAVDAQQALCGSPTAPCYVVVLGGPATLDAWQGTPLVILDSQRIVPRSR